MTTTITTLQRAQILATVITDVSASAISASSAFPTAGLFRYQFSVGAFLFNPVYFNATLSSISGSEEFFILIMADADGLGVLSTGALTAAKIPSAYYASTGTADSLEVARKTITSAGAQTFELDTAVLMRFFSFAQSPTNTWNGHLILWLCASQASLGTWSNVSMTAYNMIDYPNRDTGGPGIQSSRYSRCPITGQRVTRGEMVIDGYRGILVHPDNYDPPEPEPREWDDYPDANEDF